MTPRPERADRLPVPALVVLGASIFAAVTTEMLPVGLMPQLATSFGVDESRIGWWMSAYAGVVAAAALPIAGVLRRVARRRALVALLALYALSNGGILLAGALGSFPVALVARLVGGLAHAGLFTVVISTAVAVSPAHRQGRAVAAVNLGLTAALTLGVPLGTAVGATRTWQVAFVATAAGLVALAVLARVILPPGARTDAAAPATTPRAAAGARGALVRAALVTVVFALGHYTTYTYVAPLLLHAGTSDAGVGAALLGHGLACLPGVLLAGAFADRHPRATLRVAFALAAACLVVLAALPHSVVAGFAAVALWGAAFGAAPPLLQTVAVRTSHGSDLAPATVNAMFNVGIAAGAWSGGLVLDRSIDALPAVSAVVVLAALALTGALAPGTAPTAPGQTPRIPSTVRTARSTGHAAPAVVPATVAVTSGAPPGTAARCADQNDTPASSPSSCTTPGAHGGSHSPRPYAYAPSAVVACGVVASATSAGGTTRPASSASQNRSMSAAVVYAPPSPPPTTGRCRTCERHASPTRT
ncbi:MFS transporter [Cellulomonas fimi]|nr:MFS transporter [Cellulomonas fimi]VEH25924.1 Sugar efflux transporter B [Cellulomonas fimi]